jgi:hypothetical protein
LSTPRHWLGHVVGESCHKALDFLQLTAEFYISWIPFATFWLLVHTLKGMDDV